MTEIAKWSDQQSGTFLKRRNALASLATPKALVNHRRQLKCTIAEFFPRNSKMILYYFFFMNLNFHQNKIKRIAEYTNQYVCKAPLEEALMNVRFLRMYVFHL